MKVKVTVSNAAADYVLVRGGSLYIWLRDRGWRNGLMKLMVETERLDDGIEWDVFRVAGIVVHVDREVPIDGDRVRIRLWPLPKRLLVGGINRPDGGGGGG